MEKIKRIRLNTDCRNKVGVRFKVHIEAEDTQEKSKYEDLKKNFKALQDKTWKLAEQCVRRAYPQKDVDICHYLQNKYPNVDNTAKDSCFHFGYMKQKVDDKTDRETDR